MTAEKLSAEAQAQLAELTLKIAHDPKTRKQYAKLVKEIDPSRTFPDVEMDEFRESVKADIAAQKLADDARKTSDRLAAQRHALIATGRFKEEQVKEMETSVMEKHGISDYDVAAKIFSADLKPASPAHEIKSRTWEMPTIAKEDMGNLAAFAQRQAYAAIDEIKAKRAS
jgi:hypothetical protein